MKSYITRQFKKFMKNVNAKRFDKDCKQSSSSQLKNQDKGKKDARKSGPYTVLSRPKCFGCQGFSHMKQECPTYLKTIGKSKALVVNYFWPFLFFYFLKWIRSQNIANESLHPSIHHYHYHYYDRILTYIIISSN